MLEFKGKGHSNYLHYFMDSAVGGPWRAGCRAIRRKFPFLAATAHTPKPPERQSSHFEDWMNVRAETI